MSDVVVGSTVLTRATVVNPLTGELANATDIDLVIKDPSGNEDPVIPTNTSTGIYDYYFTVDEPGWFYPVWTVTVGSFVEVVEDCGVCGSASVLVGA